MRPKILVLCLIVSTAQMFSQSTDVPDKGKCVITGRVTHAQTGEALRKVSLRLIHVGGGGVGGSVGRIGFISGGVIAGGGNFPDIQAYTGTSEADGSFRFEGVKPGDYMLSGQRPGFLEMNYGSKSRMQAGTTLHLVAGQTLTDIKLELMPQSVISGRVVDADGDPIGGVGVQALGRLPGGGKIHYFPVSNASTDETGAFRLANLSPGKYYIVTENRMNMMGMNEAPAAPGKPDIRPVRTYYPGSLARQNANIVEVAAGQELSGINIRQVTSATFHVRGKVVGKFAEEDPKFRGGPRAMIAITPKDGDSPFELGRELLEENSNTFDFSGIAPGSYVVSYQTVNNRTQQYAQQVVEVGSSDVNNVTLNIVPTFSLHGQIVVEGTPDASANQKGLAGMHVILMNDSDGQAFRGNANAQSTSDGTLEFLNVAPGKVRFRTLNPPAGSYVKSIRLGGQDVVGKVVDLSQGSAGDVQVVLRYGAAALSGTVRAQDAKPAAAASVVVIPDQMPTDLLGFHSAKADQNGIFKIKGLAPGHYRALALQVDEGTNLGDPDLLKNLVDKAADFEVKENDIRQLNLTLVPADDLQKAIAAAESAN